MAETTSVAALRREMELMRAEQSRMHRVIVQQQIEGLTKQQTQLRREVDLMRDQTRRELDLMKQAMQQKELAAQMQRELREGLRKQGVPAIPEASHPGVPLLRPSTDKSLTIFQPGPSEFTGTLSQHMQTRVLLPV